MELFQREPLLLPRSVTRVIPEVGTKGRVFAGEEERLGSLAMNPGLWTTSKVSWGSDAWGRDKGTGLGPRWGGSLRCRRRRGRHQKPVEVFCALWKLKGCSLPCDGWASSGHAGRVALVWGADRRQPLLEESEVRGKKPGLPRDH